MTQTIWFAQGEKYTVTVEPNEPKLIVEHDANIYRHETTTIPLWWEPGKGDALQTLKEVLNIASIAEESEGWTNEEFKEEYYGNREEYMTILRATRSAFRDYHGQPKKAHGLYELVAIITTNLTANKK